MNRDPENRDPINREPIDRGTTDRGTTDRGTMDRAAVSREPMDRGTMTGDPAGGSVTPPPGRTDPRIDEMASGTEGARALRDRFDQVQAEFIDDPKSAVDHARSLVEEAVDRMMEDVRNGLGEHDDTERMRMALRRYREILDRVTSG